MWAVIASAKEYAQALPAKGGCFSVTSLPGRLSGVGGKLESTRGAQAHSEPSPCKGKQQREKKQTTDSSAVVWESSSVQSLKHPSSPCSWIPSGLRELKGAGRTRHFSSSPLIQTPFCSPGCGSSSHLMHLSGPGWTRKKLLPFLYTRRESLLPASCF